MRVIVIAFLIVFSSIVSAQNNDSDIRSGGNITLGYKTLGVTVDPEHGGRIVSLRYEGKEFLTGKDVHPSNYGSTLWPAPQSLWNWPPPVILDYEEYKEDQTENEITLVSKKDKKLGFRFIKNLSIDTADTSLVIKYTMENISNKEVAAAPWEITRMPKGGVVCFPKGSSNPRAKTFDPIPYSEFNGILWYKNDKDEELKNHLLSVSDGSEGWLAYILDGYLYLKIFEDVPAGEQFEGEGEIPVYVSPSHNYVEIEAQGKKNNLKAGASLEWKMKWIIRKLPERITEVYQNDQVIKFIHSITSHIKI